MDLKDTAEWVAKTKIGKIVARFCKNAENVRFL